MIGKKTFEPPCPCGNYQAGGYGVGALPPCVCDIKIMDIIEDELEGFSMSPSMKQAFANTIRQKMTKIILKRRNVQDD